MLISFTHVIYANAPALDLALTRQQISGWGNVNAAGGSFITGPGRHEVTTAAHGEETTTGSERRPSVLTYSRGAVSKETVAI